MMSKFLTHFKGAANDQAKMALLAQQMLMEMMQINNENPEDAKDK